MAKHQEWEVWEDDVAEALQAQKVKASGRMLLYKADVKSDTFLIDCKYTSGRSYQVTTVFWDDICMWARNEQREPAIAIRCVSPFVEAVVVRESWYCHAFGRSTAGILTRDGLSKSINMHCFAERDEFVFEIGGRRLVALPYAKFVKKVLEIESKQD